MIISVSTIEASNYAFSIDATVSDGFQNIERATGGGRCADGTYVINDYGVDVLGQKLQFDVEVDLETEQKIEYMITNYSEFVLCFLSKIMRVKMAMAFGTGNNTITFTVLEEY